MVNNPLIRPYFLGGGGIGGVPLDSHESNIVMEHPPFFSLSCKRPSTLVNMLHGYVKFTGVVPMIVLVVSMWSGGRPLTTHSIGE